MGETEATNLLASVTPQAAAPEQPGAAAAQQPAAPVEGQPAAEQQATPPAAPYQVTQEDVNSYLQRTLGQEHTLETIKGRLNAPAPVAPTYANDLSRQVDALMANGKSVVEVQNFLALQTLDTSSLDDVSAIRRSVSIQYPTLTSAEVDVQIMRKYNLDLGLDSDDPTRTAAVKVEAIEARNKIEAYKTAALSSIPEPKAPTPQTAAPTEAYPEDGSVKVLQTWWPKIASEVATGKNFAMNHTYETGEAYSFQHQYAPETIQAAVEQATKMAVSQRLPFTDASKNEIAQAIEYIAFNIEHKKIMAGIAMDAYQSAKADLMKQFSGSAPNLKVNPPAQETVKKFRMTE